MPFLVTGKNKHVAVFFDREIRKHKFDFCQCVLSTLAAVTRSISQTTEDIGRRFLDLVVVSKEVMLKSTLASAV